MKYLLLNDMSASELVISFEYAELESAIDVLNELDDEFPDTNIVDKINELEMSYLMQDPKKSLRFKDRNNIVLGAIILELIFKKSDLRLGVEPEEVLTSTADLQNIKESITLH